MGFELTPESLKKLCRDLKLYSSCPELNDVLHLQQKGIIKVQNLDKYTGLKTIYLECNAVSVIEGLDKLTQLRCLYINQNLVEHVTGLENLKLLETLDLADNQIKTIQGLSSCVALRQLNISGNRIRTKDDVEHLLECPSLISLDISKNRIDEEAAMNLIRMLPLNLLRLCGNPVLSKTWCYRKSTIACMASLKYLDDSPVFEKERRLAHAWVEGGLEAEKVMRERIRKEEDDLRAYHHKAFQDMISRVKAEAASKKQQEDFENERRRQEMAEEPAEGVVIEQGTDMDEAELRLDFDNAPSKRNGSNLELEDNCVPSKFIRTSDRADCKEQTTSTNDLMEVDEVFTVEEELVECVTEQMDGQVAEEAEAAEAAKEAGAASEAATAAEAAEQVRQNIKAVSEELRIRERDFKRQLQEKVLERAANETECPRTRPVIWGTKAYRELWDAAANIQKGDDDDEEKEEHGFTMDVDVQELQSEQVDYA